MNEAHNRKTAESQNGDKQLGTVHLPAPTPWPFLMALGLTLVGASLVTSYLAHLARRSSFRNLCAGMVPQCAAARGT